MTEMLCDKSTGEQPEAKQISMSMPRKREGRKKKPHSKQPGNVLIQGQNYKQMKSLFTFAFTAFCMKCTDSHLFLNQPNQVANTRAVLFLISLLLGRITPRPSDYPLVKNPSTIWNPSPSGAIRRLFGENRNDDSDSETGNTQ